MAKPKLLTSLENVANSISNIINGITKVGNADKLDGYDSSAFATASHTHNGYAPINHASTANTYGLGTAANYGHVKVRNDLLGTATEGETVSPAQIKGLNDRLTVKEQLNVVQITASGNWTVPANVNSVDLILIGGGGAGGSNVADAARCGGCGGGGGGEISIFYRVKTTPNQQIPITIGAGGSPGETLGLSGGNTTFLNSNFSARGGNGGTQGGVSNGGAGGNGDYSTGTEVANKGGYGGSGNYNSSSDTATPGGPGGSKFGFINALLLGKGGGGGGGGGGNYSSGGKTSIGGDGGAGAYGGGNGGRGADRNLGNFTNGSNGAANSGGGGGGGGATSLFSSPGGKGGSGGSGICIIIY